MEPNSPKKIQFSVPLFQSQLDPQAAEHIRRRRPTPATLVFYSDPPASAEDRKRMSGQTENAELLPAQRKQAVHTPPTMKEGKLLKTPMDFSFPEEEEGRNEPEPLPKEAEPLPKEPEPLPKEPKPLPKEPEPLPKEAEPLHKEAEPLPKEPEPFPKEAEPLHKEAERVNKQGGDGEP
ncbi:protein phosphatase 1 regulatory subunit 1C-like isoform X2 [Anguilla rostrata]|uniref:protein phosphatase 1 regulatory subunit 1C-like isoform X2 n=1 Tax=Anguilla rostrata TaxID=7938 RepID=UPI0030CEB864